MTAPKVSPPRRLAKPLWVALVAGWVVVAAGCTTYRVTGESCQNATEELRRIAWEDSDSFDLGATALSTVGYMCHQAYGDEYSSHLNAVCAQARRLHCD